jgi:hypothetical protein
MNGALYVFRPVPVVNKAKQSFGRFFAKQMPDNAQIDEESRERGEVKSITELERLFKIDIVQLGASKVSLSNLKHSLSSQKPG